MTGVNNAVENNSHLVKGFTAQVGARVQEPLEDFNAAVAQEFVSTNDLVEKTREKLVREMQNTTLGLQEQMRMEMQALFSEQSMKDGFLWQNLVSTCNANLCTIVNAHVEELKKAVAAHVEHEISLANDTHESKFVGSLGNLKTWMVKQLATYDQGVGARFAKMEAEQTGLRVATVGAYQVQKDFEGRYEKKQTTVEQGILSC